MTSRKSHRLVAAVGIILEIDGKRFPCMTGNVSPRGLYAMLDHPARLGTLVNIVVPEGGHKLTTTARVAANDGKGLGLSFAEGTAEFEAGWRRLIDGLRKRMAEADATDPSRAFAWSRLPDGKLLGFLRKRLHRARATDFSLEGAAFVSRARPAVGTELLIYATTTEAEEVHCRAEVTRHTDVGFAVRFEAPRPAFRHAVSRLRRHLDLE